MLSRSTIITAMSRFWEEGRLQRAAISKQNRMISVSPSAIADSAAPAASRLCRQSSTNGLPYLDVLAMSVKIASLIDTYGMKLIGGYGAHARRPFGWVGLAHGSSSRLRIICRSGCLDLLTARSSRRDFLQ
ncbi:hypothetical protein [Taklimakanibacter deserti]|uniref:hypothetical protein n=1 Tax=Taklimakanibacter deserti TaxID=2267839 RepID=UPI0013C412E8